MVNSNSRNITFIVILLLIVSFVFGYLILSNNVDKTIYTDISSFNDWYWFIRGVMIWF